MKRIPGLDFLRAIAVFLILVFHADVFTITRKMGWIGVDLFFVLSGFLVSGLLFNEYKATGKIRPLYFLVRRGFKIYPLFYFVLILHILYFSFKGISINSGQVIAEVLFFQNYREGVMGVSWSLAVEEHFYISLAIAVFIAYKSKKIENSIAIPIACFLIAIACLSLRVYTFWSRGSGLLINDVATHLRMDSLSFGVLLSYWFQFHQRLFFIFFKRFRVLLLIVSTCFLIPVFLWERGTFVINTFGHTFLYLGFGIITGLTIVLLQNNPQEFLNRWLRIPYKFMIWIGVHSYAIYLCHAIVGAGVVSLLKKNGFKNNSEPVYLIFYLTSSILAGVLLTRLIESPFLKIREKFFPNSKKTSDIIPN